MLRTAIFALATLAVSPAMAQDAPDFASAVDSAVLGVCTGAFEGTADLNDAESLASVGLAPASAADEAELREQFPGIEAAKGNFPNGNIILGYRPGDTCFVMVMGADTMTVRQELLTKLRATNAPSSVETINGDPFEAFLFTRYKVVVQTKYQSGSVLVVVTPRE